MIGLDTNVVVRYLAQDDPVQSRKATDLIENRLTVEEPGFISILAMVETVRVLERSYDLSASELAAAIERMLQIDSLLIESEQEVFMAMVALKQGLGSFSDALVSAIGVRAGCEYTVTFDKKALRFAGFEPV